jgi:hypothetical protein
MARLNQTTTHQGDVLEKGIAVKSLAGMLILCAAATAHARQAMMVDLPYRNLQPVSAGTLDATRVESAIRDGAISAGWNVMSESPGQIVLERWVSQHRMEVNVSFDDHGYDIDYRASDVLNYEIKRGAHSGSTTRAAHPPEGGSRDPRRRAHAGLARDRQ